MRARVETSQNFELYQPVPQTITEPDSKKVIFRNHNCGKFTTSHYSHFLYIIDPDGSLWELGNLFLLSKFKGPLDPKFGTLDCLARDLKVFRAWVLDNRIDYLSSSEQKLWRPTYRFHGHLSDLVLFGKIKNSTAKRRMNTVENFYRWLILEGHEFKHPLWSESTFSASFANRKYSNQHTANKTNLSSTFRTQPKTDYSNEYIFDGGKLRPLSTKEQGVLIRCLDLLGNTEMKLAFLIAISTGARLSSVFTLRRSNFEETLAHKQTFAKVLIGGSTLVHNKKNKGLVIWIPKQIYTKVQIYLNSERSKSRQNISSFRQDSVNDNEYAFLTKSGNPYYISPRDPAFSKFLYPPRGTAVHKFISSRLRPLINNNKNSFKFKFHDLRATFGMNLLEFHLNEDLNTDNAPDYFGIFTIIQQRMGHSELKTTEAYLNFRRRSDYTIKFQANFEQYLLDITSDSVTANDLD